ncbi:uncharacterized protein N7515_008369 [Penicillium bovifimosum]|uniref:Uncharacterized protein n=1 Tax=Penicillium bovifimosum TaxID=126998 RepID=A0A9W9GNA6_9EURO|nr:uncharacterized protein N7515_008369 [Penicillium bovifimosum]KAJ5124544.1 hypothetical protein N7515_008369 [Penicillium bovifimosum]
MPPVMPPIFLPPTMPYIMERTQATNLPEFEDITLPEIASLSDLEDSYHWRENVQTTLDQFGLLPVISDLKQPEIFHPDFKNWRQWSTIVSEWLLCSIEPELYLSLQRYVPNFTFADATFQGIISMSSNYDLHRTGHLLELWGMHRGDYHTLVAYVRAWREQVIICRTFKTGLSYYSAAKVMIAQLQEEAPSDCILAHRLVAYCDEDNEAMNRNQFNTVVEAFINGGMPF